MQANERVLEIIGQFAIDGVILNLKSNTEGHINSTFISTFKNGDKLEKYTHQMVNGVVFPHPEQVMENIQAITSHIRNKLEEQKADQIDKRCLQLIPTKSGAFFTKDREGRLWRTYRYIDGVRTFSVLSDAVDAYLLGGAIGTFALQLSDFDGGKLHVTIPDFHDMGVRYKQLDTAIEENKAGRMHSVSKEIAFLMENRERGMVLIDALKNGELPLRVTHNDTKMNNVLFSEQNGEALCVIDLDTVMSGTCLFDTGDMIRTGACTAKEDETDLAKVRFNITLFQSMVQGYFEKAEKFLTPKETSLIAESGRNITQIMAVRFLTDYLNGDIYYHIDRPSHNLERARTQIALMQDMDRQWGAITTFIKDLTV
ncbi:phosphotransferase family protein [Sphaerochaeta pleomorpha str. Grapes]|uniref:Phosphotransferase family protein n=1 Tax=Sphaerochaeta pleomorpha (strain ATCC BAA-1885 / DSM 22778 / Grapes) TaxID=158190 RepID=G8QVM8_SPHPG|nr:aminoglycoside phosphotransferase family protein [Sphaerochaeta pleomorpha]AEV29320.1 phosphotransferase family protein [Sphaerochaeta pleomorpha str. Grapes]